jgi:hypothetical protein
MKTNVSRAVVIAVGLTTLAVSALAQAPVQDDKHSPARDQPNQMLPGGVYYQPSAKYPSLSGANADPAARKLQADESDFARQTDELVRQLAAAKGDSDKDKIKAKLSEALEKQFDIRQQRHALEVSTLEAQLKRLQEMVQKRQESRRDIIAKRLDQLVREAQGLGW